MAERAKRLRDAARKLPFPEGTYAIGAGFVVAGVTSYAFQIITYKQLTTPESKVAYSAIFALWVIIYFVTPGFFQPLEQEVARALASRRARGMGGAPLVRRAAKLGGVLAACVILTCLAAAVPIIDRAFDDEAGLFAALLIAILAYYVQYLARGTLAGNARFRPYGILQGSEGVIRLAATGVLAVAGCTTPGPYAFALVLPAWFSTLIALRGQKHLLEPGPQAPYSELSTALGYLLLGSVLAQALSYSAYLGALALKTPVQNDRVGDFAAGILIARIPILMFQAVQAALLPKLSALAGAGREDEFLVALRRLVMIVLAVGVIGVVGCLTIGHWAGTVLFGSDFALGNRDLALLAAGSGAFILAMTLAQALIALRSYAAAALSWFAGVAGFLVALTLSDDLLLRCELGFAIGCLCAAATMFVCLVLRLRSGVPMDALERLVGDIAEEPMEL